MNSPSDIVPPKASGGYQRVTSIVRNLAALGAVTVFALGCQRTPEQRPSEPHATHAQPDRQQAPPRQTLGGQTPSVANSRVATSSQAPIKRSPPTPGELAKHYPWHHDPAIAPLAPTDNVALRFSPPEGFRRCPLPPDSFGAWLRDLPLAPSNTPVRSYRGVVLHPAGSPTIAAVSTLDTGSVDLQQCADAVMRLYAEWMWSRKRAGAVVFFAASGLKLPWARWVRGERLKAQGPSLRWVPNAKRAAPDDHSAFRRFLDQVFAWSNTVALARHSESVPLDKLTAGDFFILPGNPGHTVLVLDCAVNSAGKRVVLLGQSYMPAQSFQVLRASQHSPWFLIEPSAGGVQTPFWPDPFPWSSLRRLP